MKKYYHFIIVLVLMFLLSSCQNPKTNATKYKLNYLYEKDIVNTVETNDNSVIVAPYENDYVKTIYYLDSNGNKYNIGDKIELDENSPVELTAYVISKHQNEFEFVTHEDNIIVVDYNGDKPFIIIPNLIYLDNNYYIVNGISFNFLDNDKVNLDVYGILFPSTLDKSFSIDFTTMSFAESYNISIATTSSKYNNLKVIYDLSDAVSIYSPFSSLVYTEYPFVFDKYYHKDYFELKDDYLFYHNVEIDDKLYLVKYLGNNLNLNLPLMNNPYTISKNFLTEENVVRYLHIPSSVCDIETFAFKGVHSLRKVEMDSGNLLSIKKNIFTSCYNLYYVRLADSVKELSLAFTDNSQLSVLVVPKKLETVVDENYVSEKTYKYLEELYYLPNKTIDFPFYKIVNDESNVRIYRSLNEQSKVIEIDDYLFGEQNNKPCLLALFSDTSGSHIINEFKFPEYFNGERYYISESFFTRSTGSLQIKKLIIPGYIYEIPDKFNGSVILEELIIEEGVEKIGDSAFKNVETLETVTLPSSLKSIGKECFALCGRLSKINMPKSLDEIGENALLGSFLLYELINESELDFSVDGDLYNSIGGMYTKVVRSYDESNIKTIDNFIYYDDGIEMLLLQYTGDNRTLTLPEMIDNRTYNLYNFAAKNFDSFELLIIPNGVEKLLTSKGVVKYFDEKNGESQYSFNKIIAIENNIIVLPKTINYIAASYNNTKFIYYMGTIEEFNSLKDINPSLVDFIEKNRVYFYSEENKDDGYNYFYIKDDKYIIW